MRALLPLWLTALGILALDQATKVWIVHGLDLRTVGTIRVADPWLNLRMAWNEGVNFGIPLGDRWVLIGIAAVISLWIIVWMWRERPGFWHLVSAGLVIGGAVGNVIDRLLYGAVADFLNMSCCGFENPWSFNVADIAIFAGAAGLILLPADGKTR